MNRRRLLVGSLGLAIVGLGVSVDPDMTRWDARTGPTTTAEARIGRPLTPMSVAGVARRTTRRVIRRSTIFVPALPRSCVAVTLNGAGYYQCGATYYQPYQGQYVVVYVE